MTNEQKLKAASHNGVMTRFHCRIPGANIGDRIGDYQCVGHDHNGNQCWWDMVGEGISIELECIKDRVHDLNTYIANRESQIANHRRVIREFKKELRRLEVKLDNMGPHTD